MQAMPFSPVGGRCSVRPALQTLHVRLAASSSVRLLLDVNAIARVPHTHTATRGGGGVNRTYHAGGGGAGQRLACRNSRNRTEWYGHYTEDQYLAQKQAEERAQWAASLRSITGDKDQRAWDEHLLDPPGILSGVTVVIMSPRKPVTVGTVARACGSFECEDLRIVMPRQESYLTRHAKSASKGAQYILYRTQHYDSIAEATADCDVRVAFTRWVANSTNQYLDISSLASHPVVQAVIRQPLEPARQQEQQRELQGGGPSVHGTSTAASSGEQGAAPSDAAAIPSSSSSSSSSSVGVSAGTAAELSGKDGDRVAASSSGDERGAGLVRSQAASASGSSNDSRAVGGHRGPKVALVFGREELGMSDDEVNSCEVSCSIPIGRLQESLSLSHAVSIALCTVYQERIKVLSEGLAGAAGSTSSTSASRSSGAAPSPCLASSPAPPAMGPQPTTGASSLDDAHFEGGHDHGDVDKARVEHEEHAPTVTATAAAAAAAGNGGSSTPDGAPATATASAAYRINNTTGTVTAR